MPQQNSMVKKPEEFDVYKWDGTLTDAVFLRRWMEHLSNGRFRWEVVYYNHLSEDEGPRPYILLQAGMVREEAARLREGDILMRSRETGRWSLHHSETVEEKYSEVE